MSFKVQFKARVSYIKINNEGKNPIAQCSLSCKDLEDWISVQAKFFKTMAEKFIDNIGDGDWIEGEGKLVPQIKDKSRVDLMVFTFDKCGDQNGRPARTDNHPAPEKPKYQPQPKQPEKQPESNDFSITEDDLPF